MITTGHISSKLSNIFFLATIIPATILCFIAIGSLEKEAAFIEQEFRIQLDGEIKAVHRDTNKLLKDIHTDLFNTLVVESIDTAIAKKLYTQQPLIQTVFITAKDRTLVYPPATTQAADERAFLSWFSKVLDDTFKITPYALNVRQELANKEKVVFSQFTQLGNSGIVPIELNGELSLVFWKALKGGRLIGCQISINQLKAQLSTIIDQPKTEARILTIISDQGKPLVISEEEPQRDWRQTYMSREISRVLPNWKIAAYIHNPKVFSDKAIRITRISRVMIVALGFIIAFGGFFVIYILMQKVNLAQQKASFAAKVSHELKTPLTSIRLFSEMLLKHTKPEEKKQQKYLESILLETKRLSKLINNVLDFTSLDKKKYKYEMQSLDMTVFVREILELQSTRLEANGFVLTSNIASHALNVYGDKVALTQVIVNILSNAEKYSLDDKKIILNAYREGGHVMIDIEDHGIGLALNDREKIFEEFYRVDDRLSARQSGTGLGLTIARKIIEDHKGTLTCHPKKEGTLFKIELPIHRS